MSKKLKTEVNKKFLLKEYSEIKKIMKEHWTPGGNYNNQLYRKFIKSLSGNVITVKEIFGKGMTYESINPGSSYGYNIPIIFIQKEMTKNKNPEYFL